MLNKKETALMREIYQKTAGNNGTCLVRPVELIRGIPYNVEFDREDLVPTMKGLMYDEYFDLVETDKKGDYYFCITLLKKGFAFQRNEEMRLRTRRAKIIGSVIQKVILTLIGVGLGYLLKQLIALLSK